MLSITLAPQTAPALELVGRQLMVNGAPVLEVVHLEAVPVVIVATADTVFAVDLELFEEVTGAEPLAG